MLCRVVFSNGYYLTESSRNYTFWLFSLICPHHGVCFATTCLTIGKNGTIVPIKHIIYKWECTLLVYEILGTICRKNIIKRKVFRLLFRIFFDKINLMIFHVDLNNTVTFLIWSILLWSISFLFIGLHLTITLTASDIFGKLNYREIA